MDITAFIRELLFSHDCVIIPGFGGFIGNYSPARIDKSTSTFFPPVKQISFNRNLNHNDGLLAGRVSESAKVNYGDARNIIEEFVTSLRKKLERGEKVTFDNIGSFTNNQEGSVQFEPDHNVNYHLDSYGFGSFQFPPLEGYDVRKHISRHIDKEPVRRSPVKKILWSAAVIVPLLGVIAVLQFRTDLFKSRIETSNLNPLANAEFENNKKAVDENNAAQPVKEEENNTSLVVQQATVTIPQTADEGADYCLITGSFKSRKNAETQAAMLKEAGYSSEIIEAPNGFFRVSAMRCRDLNSALGRKDSLGEKFPGTWVKKI
jgi:nucleoid DNA-binding protein